MKFADAQGNISEIGSPELNPDLIAGKTRVSDTTPLGSVSITSSILAPTPTPDYQTEPETPLSFPVNVDTEVPPEVLTEPETEIQKQLKAIMGTNEALAGKTAFTAEQETSAGLPSLLETQKSISKRILMLQAEDKSLEDKMQLSVEGRGVTAGGLAPLTMAERRRISISANILGAQLSASKLDIASAQEQVDRAVRNKFGAQEEAQAVRIANLNLMLQDPALKLAERNRANKQLQIQKEKEAQLATAKASQEAVWNIAITSSANGSNFISDGTVEHRTLAQTLDAIGKAKTKEEALNIAVANGLIKTPKTDVTATPGSVEEFKLLKGRMPTSIEELNTFTASRSAAGREVKDAGGEKNGDNRTLQVLDGFTLLEDLTPSEAQKVRDDLFSKGFNSDIPPAWFKDFKENELQQSLLPDILQEEWIKYRDSILGGGGGGGGGGEIDFSNL